MPHDRAFIPKENLIFPNTPAGQGLFVSRTSGGRS